MSSTTEANANANTVDAPAAPPATPAKTGDDNTPNFESIFGRLQQLAQLTKELQAEVKQVQRQFTKVAKSAKSGGGRRARKDRSKGDKETTKDPNAPVSGFAKPTPLSEELCTFLHLDPGSEMSRTSVTRMLNQYIKEKNLQDSADRRTIIPDDSLRSLLRLTGDEKITYFNLQSFMKPHFTTATSGSPATVAAQ